MVWSSSSTARGPCVSTLWGWSVVVLCWLLSCSVEGVTAVAQVTLLPRQNEQQSQPNQRPYDPEALASFQHAIKGLESGQSSEGLEILQLLLDRGEDFYFPEFEVEPLRLRQEIERVLGMHRDDYQRLYGTEANELLQQASEQQIAELLVDVARRFAMTDTGAMAMEKLARWQQQQGDPVAAARWFERLATHPAVVQRRAELLMLAITCLHEAGFQAAAQLRVQTHVAELTRLAQSRKWPAPTEDTAAEWLKQVLPLEPPQADAAQVIDWTIPAGDVAQSGWSTLAPITAKPLWQHPLLDEHDQLPSEVLRTTLELMRSVDRGMQGSRERKALPVGRPIVVGDTIITSGYGIVRAFDCRTGELRWPGVVVDDTFDYLFRSSYALDHPQNIDGRRTEMIELFAASRGWRDLTSCSLSSDGRLVYAVKGCQLPNTLPPQLLQFNPTRDPRLPQRDNQLHAYDIKTGALVWTIIGEAPIGGLDPLDEQQARRSPVFFYGAPLPVQGRLFCIGEERGQVQLFELNPDALLEGEVLWSIGLLDPLQGQDILFQNYRRLAGIMPAYAGGLLICPTGEGSLVAIDIENRSVVWNHQYRSMTEELARQKLGLAARMRQVRNVSARQTIEDILEDRRWFDARLSVAGDKVLFTPPESDQLVCLDLLTGKPAWKDPLERGGRMFLGGIYQQAAILVGASDIQLVSLADGTPVWPETLDIPAPSGRGVRLDDHYLQPLSTKEIAVIELNTGRILCRLPCTLDGSLGNLVAHQGQLFAQSGTGLTAFAPLSVFLEQLPQLTDIERLMAEGEWDLQRGLTDAGVAKLKQVLAAGPNDSARQLLCWTLLECLQQDFDKYGASLAEIESYCTTPQQREQYLMTLAAGLQKTGQADESLQVYLKLLSQFSGDQALEIRDGDWKVRYDRRLGGSLLALRADRTAEQHITTFLSNLPEDPARRLAVLDLLGTASISAQAFVDALVPMKFNDVTALQREGLALQLIAEPAAARTGLGHYLLAQFALQHHDGVTAERHLRLLSQHAGQLPVVGERTGEQLVAELRTAPESQETLSAAADWPKFSHPDDLTPLTPPNQSPIEIYGPVDPALEGWTFFVDQMGAAVRIYDVDGALRGQFATGLNSNRSSGDRFARYVQLRGHIASFVFQDRLVVVDMLSHSGQPRLLCTKILAQSDILLNGSISQVSLQYANGLRGSRSRCNSQLTPWLGNVGPLLNSTLCYTTATELIAIEPSTGLDLWRRQGMPLGAEIIGDEEYTVVFSREEDQLIVLRTLDGKLVRTVALPENVLLDWGGLDWGRLIPCANVDLQQTEFSVYDPVTDQTLWSITVATQLFQHTQVAGKHFAYLDTQGVLHVLNKWDGQELWQAPLEHAVDAALLTTRLRQDSLLVITTRGDVAAPLEAESQEEEPQIADALTMTMLDATTGAFRWTHTLGKQGEYVVPDLPSRWPVIVVFSREAEGDVPQPVFPRRIVPPAVKAIVLDRNTGTVVAEQTGVRTNNQFGWSGEKLPYHRIKLRHGSIDISLKCLDTPAPSVPRQPPADETKTTPPTAPEQKE